MEKLSINKLKWIRTLHSKKSRDFEGCYIAEGEKIFHECLTEKGSSILLIVCTSEHVDTIIQYPQYNALLASGNEFERISLLKSPQGILVVLKKTPTEEISFNPAISTLVIDTIQDPGNLGTIIRTADWFGIQQIYCSANTVDCYHPRVVQATMGSLFRIKITYGNLKEFLMQQKLPIYGAMLEGTSCIDLKIKKNAILIIGNEGSGISEEISQLIQNPITIPKLGNGESLNASIACGILLSHWKKS